MSYICQICGRRYSGVACLRCTQQSIDISDFGSESLGLERLGSPEAVASPALTIPASAPLAQLKMTGSGEVFDVPKPLCRIGHDQANDIVLSGDQAVSRFHAQISFEDGEYVLRDLGTREGTYLNGKRITFDPKLFDGDHLRIGSYKFYFISDLEMS